MMSFSMALPKKVLAALWLGWSVAGLFYSLIMLHWVKFGFDSSLAAPLSGAGLCWEDGGWGGTDCFFILSCPAG